MQTSRLIVRHSPLEAVVGGCIGLVLMIAAVVAALVFGPLAIVLAVLCVLVSAAALSGLVADRGRELRDRNGREVVR